MKKRIHIISWNLAFVTISGIRGKTSSELTDLCRGDGLVAHGGDSASGAVTYRGGREELIGTTPCPTNVATVSMKPGRRLRERIRNQKEKR